MNLVVRKAAWSIGTAVAVVAAIGLAAPAQAAEEPNVSIGSVVFNGSGCTDSDAEATLDGDKILIDYADLGATAGGDGEPVNARVNCIANIKLKIDKGWQYAIGKLTMSGYAELTKGAQAQAIATHWHAGLPTTGEARNELSGPYDDDFSSSDRQHGNWSECEATRALNINAQVFVEGKNASGSSWIQLDEEQGLIADLKFRRC
jgi:hypothetical protein